MTGTHDANVRRQFGPRAAGYVASIVHASGEDLDRIEERAAQVRPRRALDLGAGGGHIAYRLAGQAQEVTACDLSEEMLSAIAETARSRGLTNIEGCLAAAEALPFDDGRFDFLGCRFSAHHWRDFEAGLREARRVLTSGAPALFVDTIAPENAVADLHLQTVEALRDPSHVRNYRASEWLAALGRAGFTVNRMATRRLRMEFATWTERMQTPETHAAAIRSLQQVASDEVSALFEIEADGSFSFDVMLLEAV